MDIHLLKKQRQAEMPVSTRQKILLYLQERHRASAPELSRVFAMTRANMQYHLDNLLKDGEIEEEPPVETQKRRGRPTRVFRLAVASKPNNLAQLASRLFSLYLNQPGISQQIPALQQLAVGMAGNEDLPKHLTQRLTRAMQILNTKRYHARWEARSQSPQIAFRNCPYAAILPDHPELCEMDTLLLQYLSGESVKQITKMDTLTGYPPACIFVLQNRMEENQAATIE